MIREGGYLKRIDIWLDQGVNVVFGGILNLATGSDRFGYQDETLSSVLGKEVRAGNCRMCYYICSVLHFIDKDHCKKSIEEDEGL